MVPIAKIEMEVAELVTRCCWGISRHSLAPGPYDLTAARGKGVWPGRRITMDRLPCL